MHSVQVHMSWGYKVGPRKFTCTWKKLIFSDFLNCTHSYQESLISEWLVMYMYILNRDHICLSSWSEKLAGMSETVIMYVWPNRMGMYIYDSGIFPVLYNVFLFSLSFPDEYQVVCALCFVYTINRDRIFLSSWSENLAGMTETVIMYIWPNSTIQELIIPVLDNVFVFFFIELSVYMYQVCVPYDLYIL